MRLFLAIQLNNAMREALVDAQGELFRRGVGGNYTPVENLHITLAFIGAYDHPEEVSDAMRTVSFAPFPIRLNGFGNFGDLWWAGLEETAALYACVRKLRHALAEAEIPFDRKRFSPHITLLRKAKFKKFPGIHVPQVEMTVDHVALLRSDRGKNGMIYTELDAFMAVETANPT